MLRHVLEILKLSSFGAKTPLRFTVCGGGPCVSFRNSGLGGVEFCDEGVWSEVWFLIFLYWGVLGFSIFGVL